MRENKYEQTCIDSLNECISTVKQTNNFVVDIGSSYNSWFLDYPFRGLLIDMDLSKINSIPHNNLYTKVASKVSTSNILETFKKNKVPKKFFILNLDIDSIDFFILLKVLSEYRPKIIITEINEKIPPPVKFAIKDIPSFDWGWCHLFGYSISCLEDIMTMFNYSMFKLDMNNVILTRNDNNETPNIEDIKYHYDKGYLNQKYPSPLAPPGWNDDVKHLHDCKTKEEVATAWKDYFINNPNPNDGSDQSTNIDNYVINDSYDSYLKEFMNKHNIV
jgi:hypothetical protein